MSEQLAGEIRSNLKRVEMSYDEELPTPVVAEPLPYVDTNNQQLMDEESRMFAENYAARDRTDGRGKSDGWDGRTKRPV